MRRRERVRRALTADEYKVWMLTQPTGADLEEMVDKAYAERLEGYRAVLDRVDAHAHDFNAKIHAAVNGV